jgi:hypothetical protein
MNSQLSVEEHLLRGRALLSAPSGHLVGVVRERVRNLLESFSMNEADFRLSGTSTK